MQVDLIFQLSAEQIQFARKALDVLKLTKELEPALRSRGPAEFFSNDLHFGTSLPMMWIGETAFIREGTSEILMEVVIRITNNQEETATIPAVVFLELTEGR